MHREVLPEVGDGIGFPGNLDGPRRGEPAVAQLLKEWQEPALAGHARSGVGVRQARDGALEGAPHATQPRPALGDRFVEPDVDQVVRGFVQPVQVGVAPEKPLQQIGREQAAFRSDRAEPLAGAPRHSSQALGTGSST